LQPEGHRFDPVRSIEVPTEGRTADLSFAQLYLHLLRLTLAALHLIAPGIGLGSVMARGSALRENPSPEGLRRVFRADTMRGIAAAVWIGTGLWRAIAGTEKSPTDYVSNEFFWAKMGMLLLILALEIWPMMTLIRWRKALARGAEPLHFGSSAPPGGWL
jgi:putative membrane protein